MDFASLRVIAEFIEEGAECLLGACIIKVQKAVASKFVKRACFPRKLTGRKRAKAAFWQASVRTACEWSCLHRTCYGPTARKCSLTIR